MTRQQANRRIVEMLDALVEAHPDLRFTQLLFNADVIVGSLNPERCVQEIRNEFYVESKDLLDRVRQSKIWEVT